MEMLLTAIVTWLSINYGLPATEHLPGVRYEQPLEITLLLVDPRTPESRSQVVRDFYALTPDKRRQVVAVYDTQHGVIVLPTGWTPRTPAELSVLVHEMVHHLQAEAGLRYPCSEAREALAYEAQEKWLGEFGTSLEKEFGMDAMTLLVTTHCGF